MKHQIYSQHYFTKYSVGASSQLLPDIPSSNLGPGTNGRKPIGQAADCKSVVVSSILTLPSMFFDIGCVAERLGIGLKPRQFTFDS